MKQLIAFDLDGTLAEKKGRAQRRIVISTVTYRVPAPEPSAFRKRIADHGMSLIMIEQSLDKGRLAYRAAAPGYRETIGDRLAAALETDSSVAGHAIRPQQG